MNKSNVIMIVADHLRYDVLGKGYTPHLDELITQSLRYENAYCASPLCVPARGSLFTGLCPNSTGSLINPWEAEDRTAGYVKAGIDNLYDIMERNGWECFHSGKQHLFTEGDMLENRPDSTVQWLSTEKTYRRYLQEQGKRMPGGTSFRSPVPEILGRKKTFLTSCSNARTGCYEEGEEFYFDRYFTSKLLEGIKKRDVNRPLFLSAMYLAPHPPFDIPEPWYSKYQLEDVCMPENVGEFYPMQSPLQLYNVTGVLGAHYTKEEWKESWRTYLGLVSFLDHCVGELISELKAQGIYDQSLIIVTSDHGEMLGSHGLFQKMCMYQESIKVPLFLKLPYQKITGDIRENVSHIDILPTLCSLLELHPLHKMEGKILPGIFSKEPGTEAVVEAGRPIFIQYDGNSALSGYQRCIIQNNFKLIVDKFKDEYFFELYDVSTDPQEKQNLISTSEGALKVLPLFNTLLEHMELTKDSLKCERDSLWTFIKDM